MLIFATLALGQSPPQCARPTKPQAYVLTFAPGEQITEVFGHTALLIYEPAKGQSSTVYDFGYFDSSDPMFVRDFIFNEQDYWGAQRTLRAAKNRYRRQDRGIIAQELNITPDELVALQENLDGRTRNRVKFRYHWLWANCTTQVVHTIDEILGGALRAQHSGRGDQTVREQFLRHTASTPLWIAFHWGGGHRASEVLSVWDGMFMPDTARDVLAVSMKGTEPLVRQTCTLLQGHAPWTPKKAPRRFWMLAAIGAVVGGGLGGLASLHRRLSGVTLGCFGVVASVVGLVMAVVGAAGTGAPYWGSHNLIFVNPLTIGIPLALIWPHRLHRWVDALGFLAIGGLFWAIVRGVPDNNPGVILAMVGAIFGARSWIQAAQTKSDDEPVRVESEGG